MQSVSSRIWTRITVSISYDDDHYTTDNYEQLVEHTKLLKLGVAASLGERKLWLQIVSQPDHVEEVGKYILGEVPLA